MGDETRELYEIKCRKKYTYVQRFNKGRAIAQKNNKKYGLIDKNGNELSKFIYDKMRYLGKGLYAAAKDGKYGILDKDGNIILECLYGDISLRHIGNEIVIEVRDTFGLWGFFDLETKSITDFKYSVINLFNKNGTAQAVEEDENVIIDKTGNTLSKGYSVMYGFCDGLAAVFDGEKWGYINENGEEVIKCQFDYAHSFNEGYARVRYNGIITFIDKNGNFQKIKSSNSKTIEGDVCEGLIAVKNHKLASKSYYTYEDINGNVIISDNPERPLFEHAGSFKSGRAMVDTVNGYGFINKEGKLVTKDNYRDVENYINDVARALSKYGKWCLIDKDGKELTKSIYDEVDDCDHGLYIARVSNKCVLLNSEGKEISKRYKSISYFEEKKARAITEDDTVVYINENGEELFTLPECTDEVDNFSDGLASINNYAGARRQVFINEEGKIEIDCSEFNEYEATIYIGRNPITIVEDTEEGIKQAVTENLIALRDGLDAILGDSKSDTTGALEQGVQKTIGTCPITV